MKKSLLLLSVAALAGMANAQVIVGLATSEELEAAGLSGTKVDMEAKTILENEAGSFGTAYQDSWGSTTTYKNYRNIMVNGEAIQLGSGAVGTANPTFISFEAGAPSAGAVFRIDCTMTGYMTVFTKMNPNKQYLVYENDVDGFIVYTVGWSNGEQKIHYSMPNDPDNEGYIDFDAADASKYLIAATIQSTNEHGVKLWENKVTHEIVASKENPTVKDDENQQYSAVMEDIPGQTKPQFPWKVEGLESAPGESTGFMTFPCYEGAFYYVCALGSKAAIGGFVYTENDPQITYQATEELPEVVFSPLIDPSGVESVAVEADKNAPFYNLMGVRVNADAKGILIQNGKKFIRK